MKSSVNRSSLEIKRSCATGAPCLGRPTTREAPINAREIAADGGTREAHYAVGLKSLVKKDVACDLKAVAIESDPARVLECPLTAHEFAADGGT